MSFVSMQFLALLLASYTLYHATRSITIQNAVILIASYVFYAWWDWRYLPLLIGLSAVNYACAIWISNATNKRVQNFILFVALVASFGALAIFKYFGFFVRSFAELLGYIGIPVFEPTLSIVLPLGISFITFQGAAYVIDVWRGHHVAERNLIRFFAFKAFFPQLIAGPIERATHLLDQFAKPRTIDAESIRSAIWLLTYGYFLKVVFANSMAPIVDSLFVPDQPFGWSVVLGTIAFGIQIYADFNGYSTIAKGAARLFGFDLVWNFRFPYWASSISDFWRTWHISLSNWLRDYLYIPLGGNRLGQSTTVRNLLITMTLGGLWHGASWSFIWWGLLHGIALAGWRLLNIPSRPTTRLGRAVGWCSTMAVVFVGWFLFRAPDPSIRSGMIDALGNWEFAPVHHALLVAILATAIPLTAMEWLFRSRGDFAMLRWPPWLTSLVLGSMVVLVLAMTRRHQASFIYFQF